MLERAPQALSDFTGVDELWLKREDLHELGMFKWRGALPVVRHLVAGGASTIVTSSTGNHGAAVAWACRRVGATAAVFVPPGSTPAKLELLRSLGADVRVAGRDFDEAKEAARTHAHEIGLPFFEDGAEPLQYDAYEAIGSEIVAECPTQPAVVVTPVGNGALAAGVGAAMPPGTLRVGVVASELPVMAASYEAGRVVDVPSGTTIADGLAVRVAIPLAVERLRTTIDRMVRVSEQELLDALVACHDAGVEIEPSAAAAVAAASRLDTDGLAVLVITGRNVDPAVLERGRLLRQQ